MLYLIIIYSLKHSIMNAARRKILNAELETLDAVKGVIEEIAEEEREALENMPESLQDGETGQAMLEKADELDEIAGEMEDLRSRLEEVTA